MNTSGSWDIIMDTLKSLTLENIGIYGIEAFILASIVFLMIYIRGLKHKNLKNQLNIRQFLKIFILFWAIATVIFTMGPKIATGYNIGRGFGLGAMLIKGQLPQLSFFEGQDGRQELMFTPEQRAALSAYLSNEQIKRLEKEATSTLMEVSKKGLSDQDRKILSQVMNEKQIQDLDKSIKESAKDRLKTQRDLLKQAGIELDTMLDTSKTADVLAGIGPITSGDGPLTTGTEVLPKELSDSSLLKKEEEEEEEQRMVQQREDELAALRRSQIDQDQLVLNTSFVDRAPLLGTFASNRDALGDYTLFNSSYLA